MYLKTIEVQGFKSFADKLKLEFDKGITSIVGPNGSGKSNVSDAIRWVLGEQSAKSLRGSKMEDIIFAGTENRRPLGFAEVTITFDNEDHFIPIDYTEVSIKRRVYRSGESEYYINQSQCRLKDITELLIDTGIGKEGYSIIGQGQVEKILSSRQEDKRILFEEAAGISKYKLRKHEAEKKLEQERLNLLRLEDIIVEIEGQISILSEQAVVAKKYLALRDQIKEYDLNIFLKEHEKFKNDITTLEKKLNTIQLEKEENHHSFEEMKKKKNQLVSLIGQMEDDLQKLQEKQSLHSSELEKREGLIHLTEEQINHLTLEKERMKKISEETQEQELHKQKQKEKVTIQMKEFDSLLTRKNKELMELLQKQEDLQKTMADGEKQTNTLQDQLFQVSMNIKNDEHEIQYIQRTLEDIILRSEEFHKKIEEKKQAAEEIIQEVEKIQKDQELLTEKIHQLEKQKKMLEEECKKIEGSIASLQNDLRVEQNQLGTLQSKYSFLHEIYNDYEGFHKPVKELMLNKKQDPSKWSEIMHVVGELIEVPKKYETAVEVALGGSIQFIVTENEEEAHEAIEFLKNRKLGRSTFLPLPSIKKNNIQLKNQSLLAEEGVLGLASSVVQCEPTYQQVIHYLLGKVLIVDTYKTGVRISKKYGHAFKIVTIEGELFHVGGSITGGSLQKRKSNILGRKRDIKVLGVEIEKQKEIIEKLEIKIETIRSQFANMKDELEKENHHLSQSLQNQQRLNQDIENRNHKITGIQEEIEQLQHEKDMSKNVIKENLEKKEIIAKRMDLHKVEHKRLQDKALEVKETMVVDEEKKNALNQNITQVKIDLTTYQERRNALESELKRLEEEIIRLIRQKSDSSKRYQELHESCEEKQRSIETLKDEVKQKNSEFKNCSDTINDLLVNRKGQQELLKENEKAFEEQMNRIHLFEKEEFRIQNLKDKSQLQLDALCEKIWLDYELTYNSSVEWEKELGTFSEMKKTRMSLWEGMKALGDVNITAIEEYSTLKQRYDFITAQKQDIILAEEKLMTVIKDLTQAMQEQFARQFEVISDLFNQVFQKLFGGGKAVIQLSDKKNVLESDIEIIAQPPGKKLQSMSLLSGGEKSLTAIALLFAIQSMNPSPFCIIDEIEAALDDVNVDRFAVYLKDLSKHTQFVVITHKKGTMKVANALYGITMQEKGISTFVSVKFEDMAS